MILYKTQRLVIRRWKSDDAADLFDYCSNPEVTKFLNFTTYKDIDEAHERIKYMAKVYFISGQEMVDYAIELVGTGRVIGSIGVMIDSAKAGGVVELGYILNPKYQGNGYMTEAVRGMFKYIKDNSLAMRIQAKHDTENVASGRVMKRAGMTFEGVHRKSSGNNKNLRADMAYYSILAEEII